MALPLEIVGLEVRAGARRLLSVPSLSVPAGALVGVRGPSGAGKSTLLHALSGLLAFEGRVRWGGVDLGELSAERRAAFRAARVGMIFQDFLLFDELSPIGNAAISGLFGKRRQQAGVQARAVEALQHFRVPGDRRAVASFSGGERQRVAVARALASDPAILLADEPTASLDRPAADRLIDDLATLVRDKGKTLIAVSHDTHLLERMDRVLTVEDGRLAADGRQVQA